MSAGGGARVYAVLAAGVLVVSTSSILIRYAHAEGVPSLSIAALRLTLASVILLPLAIFRAGGEIAAFSARERGLALASGVFLALHFAAWIVSLEYTSVASSVALVTTNPIWIALFSVLVLRERMPAVRALAVALALGGSGVILWADSSGPVPGAPSPMLGNVLALVGSLTVCGYLLIGRRLRARLSLLAYIGVVYSVAAVSLLVMALAAGAPLTGFSPLAWTMIAGMALGPQLLGHSAFNYALRHVSATMIALAVLGEPVGSTLFAWLLFGEAVGAVKLGGMALLLAGIFLAAKSEAA